MTAAFQFSLLLVCWLAALATLLVFLENWFSLSAPQSFTPRRASGVYGVVTVFLPLKGGVGTLDPVVRSILNQSYPFLELVLISEEDAPNYAAFIREIQAIRTHIPIRTSVASFPIDSETGRVRALDQAHSGVKGKWWVVLQPDVILDRLAIEYALEFAGSNGMAAIALRSGIHCSSFFDKALAPCMEYLAEATRIFVHRKERSTPTNTDPSFLLVNRETFEAVNRMNRIPGVLNEAGWSLWSYRVEGLRTFDGDGSLWIWREAQASNWSAASGETGVRGLREAVFVVATAMLSMISVAGFFIVPALRIGGFSGASILAFSAISYVLMTLGYLMFGVRLRAWRWPAPLWFLFQGPAAVLTVIDIRRNLKQRNTDVQSAHTPGVSRSI